MKNSEWLALFAVPGAVISREFRSSKEIRIKRATPFPVYVENPNRLTIHDPLWDEKLFQGGWMKNHPLKCGCANEWRCIHFQWPEWTGDEGEDFGGEEVRGLGGDQASGEPNQLSLDSGVDVGTEGTRAPGGHPTRGEEDRNSGDSRVAMGEGGISAARRASLLAKEKQESVEKVLGNKEAFRAMSPAVYSGAEIQSNTKMTIEGVQTSGNNSIAAKPKHGTAENPVQIL
ncbi:hypothetical protein BGZ57DRAFT_883751 [Hyaloscypha finlandica]|nr:hypothetical protein BGZ57DRAFT_883751 [Hyaloscypha finlandica]